jgi:uncharacterized OsmC-like protein
LTLQSIIARKRAKGDDICLGINAYAEETGRRRVKRIQLAEKISELLDAERQAKGWLRLAQEELKEIDLDLQDTGA